MNQINSPATAAIDNDPLFTAAEVAARYEFAEQTLANWRHAKTGPRYVKLPGGRVRYRLSDLLAWEHTFSSPTMAVAA